MTLPPPGLSLTVVVPTLRRPDWLLRCLDGLSRQDRAVDEIVVVCRGDDEETLAALTTWRGRVVVATVREPGVLAALAAGVARATGDVIAFTDDDAVPRPDWAERLLAHYARPDVGGVGGRDVVRGEEGPLVPSSFVGRVTRWGRLVGYHHLGSGPAVDVDVLKGVNMSFRREAVLLPRHLRGSGAQVHNELALSLAARQRGWRLVYDPAVLVDHYTAPRFDDDQRGRPSDGAIADEAFNLVWAMLTFRPELARRRALYGLLRGDAATPGLVRGAMALVRGEHDVRRRTRPSLQGQWAALRALRAEPAEPPGP